MKVVGHLDEYRCAVGVIVKSVSGSCAAQSSQRLRRGMDHERDQLAKLGKRPLHRYLVADVGVDVTGAPKFGFETGARGSDASLVAPLSEHPAERPDRTSGNHDLVMVEAGIRQSRSDQR